MRYKMWMIVMVIWDTLLVLLQKCCTISLLNTWNQTLKSTLFQYCINAYQGRKFEGWDWHIAMLEIAAELIQNEQDLEQVLNCIHTVSATQRYRFGVVQHIKLKLFRKYKTQEEIDQLVENNLEIPSFRQEEIEIAIEQQNYDRAIKLAQDGIQQDKNNYPGLVNKWYNYLLKTAQAQDNRAKTIEYASYLLISNFYVEQDYYQLLKDNVPAQEWSGFRDNLIKDINSRSRWGNYGLVREIYIKDELWDKLLDLLKNNLSLSEIERNEQYLAKDYVRELIEWYYELIPVYVEENTGRKHYQTACKYIRRMKKLGGKPEAKHIIEFLKSEFPRRRALLEELNQV